MAIFYLIEKEICCINKKNIEKYARTINESTIIKYYQNIIKFYLSLFDSIFYVTLIHVEFIIFICNFTLPIFVLFNMGFAKTSFSRKL